ncbi:hypothetical protein [Kribbella sp. HUAS MG21]|uniref:Uncharacterized protein n=1 Tax=Kribbella sp. HUAS MG21 TaxID=3160966 RepID=A0AAU7TE90_9ACTN
MDKDWWDYRPVFSTTDKGSRITGLAPGEPVGRITTRLVVTTALCFAAWGAASLLGTSLLCQATSAPESTCVVNVPLDVPVVWRVLAAIVVVYLLLLVTVDLGEHARQRLGQRRVAVLLWSAPTLAGIAVGAGISTGTAFAPDPSGTLRRTLDGLIGTEAIALSAVLTVLAGFWWITVVARVPSALRHARRRQETIERVRRDGRRFTGSVRLGDVRFWLGRNPELDVAIVYHSPSGSHVLPGRMRTSPDRVPADGSPVVIFDDLRGVVHVELDVDAEFAFEPEQRYTAAE